MKSETSIDKGIMHWKVAGTIMDEDAIILNQLADGMLTKVRKTAKVTGEKLSILADFRKTRDIEPMAREPIIPIIEYHSKHVTKWAVLLDSKNMNEIFKIIKYLSNAKNLQIFHDKEKAMAWLKDESD